MKSLLGGIWDAFEDRNFRRYSIGSIVSWISFFVQMVAISWATWSLTHSTGWLALIALIDAAPNVLLMPLGGVIADRFDRFRIVMISYAFALLHALALTLLAWTDQLTIGWLAALSFLNGVIHAFSVPAHFGILPRFVARRRLSSAISVAAAYTQLAVFAGPALAGWLIPHFGIAIAFASNVVGYAVYFGCVAFLRTPGDYVQSPASGKAFAADFLDGLRVIAGHRGITALLALMLVGDAMFSAIRQMTPAYADRVLNMGVEGLSWLLAASGVGATLSAFWLAQGGAARAKPEIILWAFLGLVAGVALLMLADSLIPAVLAMIALGCFFEICRTGSVALLQLTIPDELRGRVMSTQFLLLRLAGALGVVGIGAAAEGWGLRPPLLLCASVAWLAWLAAYLDRSRITAAFSTA